MDITEEWVNENYQQLREAARKITGNAQADMIEELLHYTLDTFLNNAKAVDIINSGGGRFYCERVMLNSWQSATSPFHHTYLRGTADIEEAIDIPEEEVEDLAPMIAKIRIELTKLPWYDRMLFETFVNEGHTITSLARATGIPRTSISLTINRIKKHLKKII